MSKKQVKGILYTKGKFTSEFRKVEDTKNEFLYSKGVYKTKIRVEDLPSDFEEIYSRSIWYMVGYIKTSGVVDIKYKASLVNHMFKDDYIYISYKNKIKTTKNFLGLKDYEDYDLCICGNSIVDIIRAIEKNTGKSYATRKVREEIEKKRIWYRDNHPDDYYREVGEDKNVFELY